MAIDTSGTNDSNSVSSMVTGLSSQEYFMPQYTKKPLPELDTTVQDQPFDNIQLTKLLIDALQQLGYQDSALMLQKESGGVLVESEHVKALFTAIKEGRCEDCNLELLFRLPLSLESAEISGDLCHIQLPTSDKSATSVIDHFIIEYGKLTSIMKQLGHWQEVDIIKLTVCVEMFVAVQTLLFSEILSTDRRMALELLRSVIRPTISIWDSLLTLQSVKCSVDTQILEKDPSLPYLQPDQLLSRLSTLIACGQSPDLFVTRESTFKQISRYINPNDLVPRGRLIQLLKQSIQYQKSRDLLSFHVDSAGLGSQQKRMTYNLLQDNITKSTHFHFENLKTLNRNNDEIWFLQFSPDGRFLASASPSKQYERKIIIYDVTKNFEIYAVCSDTRQSVLYLRFSPDSTKLVACSINSSAKIYDLNQISQPTYDGYLCEYNQLKPSGSVFVPFLNTPDSSSGNNNSSTANGNTSQSSETMRLWCADWFHDPSLKDFLILGSPDSDVIVYDMQTKTVVVRISQTMGEELHTLFPHVHDIKISSDDQDLIVMNNENYIDIFDISGLKKMITGNAPLKTPRIKRLYIGKRMTGMQFPEVSLPAADPQLSSLILVSIQNQELQLWDYRRDILLQRYIGQIQTQFIIRSCFGYYSNFIASGSEDGKIYLWDRYYGNIVGVISAHLEEPSYSKSKICNIVAWNPMDQSMFASGGDDGLIKIWKVSST